MARLRTTSFLLSSFGLVSFLSVYLTEAAATIQIVTPSDQGFVNSGGGSPAPVEVTYQVTGNTCTGFRSSFNIAPYVNGEPVACAGECGCDGTTESCNNITRTITLEGNDSAAGSTASRCGPLGCTLMHELTHQIGHFREKRPRQVETCLGCR